MVNKDNTDTDFGFGSREWLGDGSSVYDQEVLPWQSLCGDRYISYEDVHEGFGLYGDVRGDVKVCFRCVRCDTIVKGRTEDEAMNRFRFHVRLKHG